MGAERVSRYLKYLLNIRGERVHAAKNAPRDPFQILEGRHGLAEIVERGAVGFDERQRVILPHPERRLVIILFGFARRRIEEAVRRGASD